MYPEWDLSTAENNLQVFWGTTPLSLSKFYVRFARNPKSWSATDMNTCTAENVGRPVCKDHYDTYVMCPLCVDTQTLWALNPCQQECMSRRK